MSDHPGFWWVMHSDTVLALLNRASEGEDPDLLIAEHYANSRTDDQEPT